MPVAIRQVDVTRACEFPVCVVAHSSLVGAHVALWYSCDPPGAHRLLHQAWHYLTCDDAPAEFLARGHGGGPVVMVVPTLDEDEAKDLRLMCAMVARRLKRTGGIGYALNSRDVTVRADGTFDLGASRGVTCATFVLKIFQALALPLLSEETWAEITDLGRLQDDRDAQATIVAGLLAMAGNRTDHQEREAIEAHARAVETEIGTPRIRAEEVAAASGLTPRPAPYVVVEAAGSAILCAVKPSRGDPPAPVRPPSGAMRTPEGSLDR